MTTHLNVGNDYRIGTDVGPVDSGKVNALNVCRSYPTALHLRDNEGYLPDWKLSFCNDTFQTLYPIIPKMPHTVLRKRADFIKFRNKWIQNFLCFPGGFWVGYSDNRGHFKVIILHFSITNVLS